MAAQLPPPEGSLPLLESAKSDTDPDPFGHLHKTIPGYAGPDVDTVPRCITCGQVTLKDTPTAFDQGVSYALQGVFWMLKQRLTEPEAKQLTLWFEQGLRP